MVACYVLHNIGLCISELHSVLISQPHYGGPQQLS